MNRFFKRDSKLFDFMTMILELAEVNILFLVFSIPIVTMGAAYTAMMDSLFTMQRFGEGCFSIKRFVLVFGRAFKKMTLPWVISLTVITVMIINAVNIRSIFSPKIAFILTGLYILMMILLVGTMQFSSVWFVVSEKRKLSDMKNCFLMTLLSLPKVIVSVLLTMSVLVILLLPGAMLLRLLPIILLYWCVCPAYVCCSIYIKALKRYFPELFNEEIPDEETAFRLEADQDHHCN